jgi:hypothetical protein
MTFTPRHYRLLRTVALELPRAFGARFLPEDVPWEWEADALETMEQEGLIARDNSVWVVSDAGRDVLEKYKHDLGDADLVRRELEALHQYAQAVRRAAERSADRSDIVDGGRGYDVGDRYVLVGPLVCTSQRVLHAQRREGAGGNAFHHLAGRSVDRHSGGAYHGSRPPGKPARRWLNG